MATKIHNNNKVRNHSPRTTLKRRSEKPLSGCHLPYTIKPVYTMILSIKLFSYLLNTKSPEKLYIPTSFQHILSILKVNSELEGSA